MIAQPTFASSLPGQRRRSAPATLPPDASNVTRRTTAPRKNRDLPQQGQRDQRKTSKSRTTRGLTTPARSQRTIGLKGHVSARPSRGLLELAENRSARPDRRRADQRSRPTRTSSRRSARSPGGRELVIATDFDRAGELIGLEALERCRCQSDVGNREEPRPARCGSCAPATRADQRRDRARLQRARRLSYTAGNAGAAAGTSTCSGARR